MLKKYYKRYQLPKSAETWQHILKHKEMMKNNLQISGDMKIAKEFVNSFHTYKPHRHFTGHGEHVIFTREHMNPAYAFATK